ncbi:stage II sporulation protein P [Clostridium sp. WILCCON 0269]|uniref:Stage II sporulation protein P n=1 Tax=Candidatus Clostridium eludens TaxID=3381663 RepID=A0ABW8SIV2_9CLOT
MKNIYKSAVVVVAFLTLTAGGYTYSKYHNKLTVNKAVTSNTVPTNTKTSSNSYTENSIVPFSSDIVIYNSHPDETYLSGKNITDVGALINDELAKVGLNSSFIKVTAPKEYTKSYENTRNIITKNVKNYASTTLLDVSRDESNNATTDTKKIRLILTQASPRYEANKKFANQLLEQLKKANGVTAEIIEFKTDTLSYFNEDLSNNTILIEIGNDKSSDSDIQQSVNVLAASLKNIQNK